MKEPINDCKALVLHETDPPEESRFTQTLSKRNKDECVFLYNGICRYR